MCIFNGNVKFLNILKLDIIEYVLIRENIVPVQR